MKTNLAARLIRALKPARLPLGFLALIGAFCLTGCGTTPPAPFEQYLFTSVTNYTPKVETVTVTNTVTVTVTNTAGAVHDQAIVSVITTQQTNMLATVTTTPSVALQSWAGLASGVANTVSPGSGGIVGLGLLGIAGFFGINRQRKLTEAVRASEGHASAATTAQAVAENFAQSIEVLREVLKTTPQGQVLDVKIVDMLQRNQMTVGLIRDAAAIVDNTVSNAAAKAAAQKILALLPTA
jgi:hypothetical protein